MKNTIQSLILIAILAGNTGCGNGDTQIPTDKLTEEQLEEVRQEDDAIEDEEGGGGL